MSMIYHVNISSGAQKNIVNVRIVLLATHRSARHMRLMSCHLLQPIANLPMPSYQLTHVVNSGHYPYALCYEYHDSLSILWQFLKNCWSCILDWTGHISSTIIYANIWRGIRNFVEVNPLENYSIYSNPVLETIQGGQKKRTANVDQIWLNLLIPWDRVTF